MSKPRHILPAAPSVVDDGYIWPQCCGNCVYSEGMWQFAAYAINRITMLGTNDNRLGAVH